MVDLPPTGTGVSGPGPGWWQASDGNWYPPEQQPGYGGAPTNFGYGYGAGVQVTQSTNGWAIASLVVTLVFCGVGAPLGIIFGHIGLSRAKAGGGGGRGLAIAGLVISYLTLAVIIVAIVAIVLLGDEASTRFDEIETQIGWIPR